MTLPIRLPGVRRKAVWGPKRIVAAVLLIVFGLAPGASAKSGPGRNSGNGKSGNGSARSGPSPNAKGRINRIKRYRLDDAVTRLKNGNPLHTSSVIVTMVPGAKLPANFKKFARGARLDLINGQVLELPNGIIKQLEAHPEIFQVHYNRPTANFNYRTSVAVGAMTSRLFYGYDGAGVGVAVIDSGIASWHDDLSGTSNTLTHPYGNQRVRKFVDFVNGQTLPYDDNGHGTHVSGIIAGNGYDSSFNEKAGIAPKASIISLKVLDARGVGTIGNMIAAMNWIAQNHAAYNIRVVNMSVGARITESYWTDPLTLAAKALVDKGIVVVGAAGNFGKNPLGELQYGGITAPANAPWVLTVGASSTNGTFSRYDDTVAGYSSSGPTNVDFDAKPDLVAPGTGTVSLAAPGSTFYANKAQYLVGGKFGLNYKPYIVLSGTSMAAPVVAGTVAMMFQANPNLTPNLVKAILQYTAQQYPGYNSLRQGAGFLNTLGAVRLASFYKDNKAGARMPVQPVWSRQIIWGNHRVKGGYLNPKANAWALSTLWGAAQTFDFDNIIWGTDCPDVSCDNIIWGTVDALFDNIIWGTEDVLDNIIWGTEFVGDNIIWGTADADNVIWGTNCGGADCDNIIWGTASESDNIIWGTAEQGASVVWLQNGLDNVIWGTSAEEDVTWGSSSPDEVIYPDESTEPLPDMLLELGEQPAAPPASEEPAADSDSGLLTNLIGGGL